MGLPTSANQVQNMVSVWIEWKRNNMNISIELWVTQPPLETSHVNRPLLRKWLCDYRASRSSKNCSKEVIAPKTSLNKEKAIPL